MRPELLKSLFERAAREELGIAIATNSVERLVQELHTYRRNIRDPSLEHFTIATPSEGDTVFIVRKSVELDNV